MERLRFEIDNTNRPLDYTVVCKVLDCLRICLREKEDAAEVTNSHSLQLLLGVAETAMGEEEDGSSGSSGNKWLVSELSLRCLTNALNQNTAAAAAFIAVSDASAGAGATGEKRRRDKKKE